MSYCGYIVTIKNLRSHSNADRLQVATIFGNDVIVGLDVNVGDAGIYFPTDGKLSIDYAVENKLTRNMGGYLDDNKRNIKAIKLRGEKSDGLFMPLSSLNRFVDISTLNEGDTVTTLGGKLICQKYIPKGREGKPMPNQKKKNKVNNYPFFDQHADTAQLAYNTRSLKEGDICYISLKLHGTSQRTAHTIKKGSGLWNKFIKMIGFKTNSWEYVTGTRRVTLDSFDGGFYGDNSFRSQWHDLFKGKLQKGEEVFYEVVGYASNDKLIMATCNNKKTKDKEFIKQFGDTTRFTYGCGVGESDVYVYRMTMTNEEGYVVEYPTELVQLRCEQMGVKHVPVFEKFIFTTEEDMLERVGKYENGEDPIDKTHIREGVILRVDNSEKFKAYKQKNFHFKVLEGIIKEDAVEPDMEEAESEVIQYG